ncbi:hypothetical protein HYH03_014331 [Edaphochlamys debaryana]|uniref:Signal recognition particle 19 kDa protein n=1 Tax=Edaphochlamys debaryana TaxID=47281 RepID=A0A835XRU4_9CHLO|nr:hypothetical protein HYH03_014331 [Edaphochlamys debaryana]|eukprot:KAG2487086.1 hypothetical protein HYH03_014331 [Edaphochlamys debaryana]
MNPDRRVIVYPNYIDSEKTVAEGRRLPKNLAVDGPFVDEILAACKTLGLDAMIESKHYPREWRPKGRVRVALKDAAGKPMHPDIPDRRTLLLRLADAVAKDPRRLNKPKQSKPDEGAGGSGSGASGSKPAAAAAPAASSGGSKKGKKGKK